ncbi:colanic acid biosynthesis glycosyltransferase WcaL [Acuticoccus sediminis]|uniref:Colanic acid biosynthesis glycosyltransferase WcaL n=1 Tax=Acuticoccus sediminis TaxID=2184697 RepID=A0A8B2NUV5_9HYPH|nr:glycosyltransferase [Acuticoccus sediminis]RAH99416.1 colanic acid biosynthesis glycosyltransferase WcaL [Acuticoccus sediminis]
MGGRVAVVVKGYPRLSETFIAQEILGLQRRGIDLTIVSLRHPTESAVHEVHRQITAPVLYLPEYLKDDPARVRAARRIAEGLPGYARAEAAYRRDLERDPSASRRRRWGQAAVLAAELPEGTGAIYVHYLHTPASVARYASLMTGVPYAFSAHAKDIYTTPEWDLREKIADAEWGTTCTAANRDVLDRLAPRGRSVDLVYHGLDLSLFHPEAKRGEGPLRILSVCRAVEKKGLDDVFRALARLDVDWRFEHVGGGGLVKDLTGLAERLGIADRIAFLGALPREDVVAAYRRADVFVLASRIARNGDRDGLPNVIMEAMAMGLPVVSTEVSAVPEIVTAETGILVPPRDAAALGKALADLAASPETRTRLGQAGAARVTSHFSPDPGLDHIAARLTQTMSARQAA